MLALYTSSIGREVAEIRAELLRHGVPCIVLGPHSDHNCILDRIPFVYFYEDSKGLYDIFTHKIPDFRILHSNELPTADSLTECLRSVYGIDFNCMTHGGARFDGNDFYFHNNYIYLTHSERLIARFLTLCHGLYFTAAQISALCLETENSGTVAAHVAHINKKNSAPYTERIIDTRRYYGYRIP